MNVPKLRFKEFNDEWQNYKVEEILKISNGINKEKEFFGSGTPIINYMDVNKNELISHNIVKGLVIANSKELETFNVKKGDILFTRTSETSDEIGLSSSVIENIDKCIFSGFILKGTQIKQFIHPYFGGYYFRNPKMRKEIIKHSSITTRALTSGSLLSQMSISIPTIIEQEKIGKTLSLLDKKIKLQTKKIEDLKLFKKGFIEFEFSNSNYNEINLKEILKERKAYSEKGLEFPHVTLSKDGIYDKTDRYNRDFLVKSDDKKYKITYLNDLCYNPANLKFGVICLNEYGSAIFSPIYVTFVIKNIANPKYIKYYVTRNNFINAIRKYEQGTVYERMAVAPEDFLKFSIKLPNIEIQNKFVDKLSKLDQKIDLENLKLSRYIKLKKGLMQNMFV